VFKGSLVALPTFPLLPILCSDFDVFYFFLSGTSSVSNFIRAELILTIFNGLPRIIRISALFPFLRLETDYRGRPRKALGFCCSTLFSLLISFSLSAVLLFPRQIAFFRPLYYKAFKPAKAGLLKAAIVPLPSLPSFPH